MAGQARVKCRKHGDAHTTYVCAHLAENPVQRWYSDVPTERKRWPDAWCSRCQVEFLKEGEWNEKNEQGLVAKILCHECYEAAQARSLERPLDGPAARVARALTERSQEALRAKQRQLEAKFGLGRHKRWDWDQATGQLVFSNDGVPAIACDIAFVGSVSTLSDTWLWSWANFSLTESVRSPMLRVREFGEAQDLPRLTVPKWPAGEADGWEMTAIAVEILGASGAYRTPSKNGFTFLALLSVSRVQ